MSWKRLLEYYKRVCGNHLNLSRSSEILWGGELVCVWGGLVYLWWIFWWWIFNFLKVNIDWIDFLVNSSPNKLWNLNDWNRIRTLIHLIGKRTLHHLHNDGLTVSFCYVAYLHRMNLNSEVAWMSRNCFLGKSAISEI